MTVVHHVCILRWTPALLHVRRDEEGYMALIEQMLLIDENYEILFLRDKFMCCKKATLREFLYAVH